MQELASLDRCSILFGELYHTCSSFVSAGWTSCRFLTAETRTFKKKCGFTSALPAGLLCRIYVIDLGSVHGTFVANERLTKELPVELELGQSLRFAASTRSYVLRKASPPVQEAEQAPTVPEEDPESPRLKNPRTGKRVTFRDDYGGLLVEVVGISDGADVSSEPGPIGVKEGVCGEGRVSCAGPCDSQEPERERHGRCRYLPEFGDKQPGLITGGVTERLKVYLDKVKAPAKGGIYGDFYGESLAEIKEGSWAENNRFDTQTAVKEDGLHASNTIELATNHDGPSAAGAPAKIDGPSLSVSHPLLVASKGEDLFTDR